MVAHLSNSPDFVHVPFERIMAEQELRDVRRRFVFTPLVFRASGCSLYCTNPFSYPPSCFVFFTTMCRTYRGFTRLPVDCLLSIQK